MANPRSIVPWRTILVVVLVLVALAIVRPWTVRPLKTMQAGAFDATAYASQVWPKLIEVAGRTAIDVAATRQTPAGQAAGPGRRSVFVNATGIVIGIDRKSRVGLMRMRVDDGSAEVALQVGPVIRGTALRDAATFIQFNDFSNQFEFAAVSSALHARVLQHVIGRLDLDALVGQRVAVLGAATLPAAGAVSNSLDLVPVQITPLGVTP